MAGNTSSGGKPMPRDVMNYATPQGPKSLGNRGPGLGGTNFGNCACPNENTPQTSGRPGLGGERMSAQGRR